ncbi:hypothetical protein J3B02_002911 [Coemansia erecta]|nr:hypothetical protein J3B02_002911 [Coemansia erecta]
MAPSISSSAIAALSIDSDAMDVSVDSKKVAKDKKISKTKSDKDKKDKKSKKENKEKKSKKRKHSSSPSASGSSSSSDSEAEADKQVQPSKKAHIDSVSDESSEDSAGQNEENKLSLDNFPLSASTKSALISRGISALFPIQASTLVPILEGNDVLGRARTGTGKTLAFSLPMIELMLKSSDNLQRGRRPRAVVLAPTRELAKQVAAEIESTTKRLVVVTVYGGTSIYDQQQKLRGGADFVVGTPGRVIDLIDRGNLALDNVEFICLDEADQMLDIGFKDDMEKVLRCVQEQRSGKKYQTLLFSATVPEWVNQVARDFMRPDHKKIDLIGSQALKTSETIVYKAVMTPWRVRHDIVSDLVAVYGRAGRTIIFTETKADANSLAVSPKLVSVAQALHGDIPQSQREQTLQGFRNGTVRVLICTDVAARGLDIPEVDLVINVSPPKDAETFIHRSGRTGRAGRSGVCITGFSQQESWWVGFIKKRTGVECEMISPPQAQAIVQTTGMETAKVVGQCSVAAADMFMDTAEALANETFEGDSMRALAAALAHISGYSEGIQRRSVLTGDSDRVTMIMHTEEQVKTWGYVRGAMVRTFPGLEDRDMSTFRIVVGRNAVVFDILSKFVEERTVKGDDGETETVISVKGRQWDSQNSRMRLEFCTELPEFEDDGSYNGVSGGNTGSSGFGRGGRSFGGGRGGSRGGSRGGFRSGRGGGRGRGRGRN